jgi:hypothetical protein
MPTLARHRPAATTQHPFALPKALSPDLCRVLDDWRGLLRGEAEMPFADDLKLTDLPDLAPNLFVIDVFDRPERFRVALVGEGLQAHDLRGRFLDEVPPGWPFQYLRAQCAATVEAGAPTFFHAELAVRPYSRLILPLWGEGRISTLLGAIDAD